MTHITDHTPDADGMFTLRTPGASLFALCASVLGAPRSESTQADRRRFHAVLCELLDAARAGGFEHADELDALVLSGKVNGRSVALAHEAERCAGAERVRAVYVRHEL